MKEYTHVVLVVLKLTIVWTIKMEPNGSLASRDVWVHIDMPLDPYACVRHGAVYNPKRRDVLHSLEAIRNRHKVISKQRAVRV